MFSYSLGVTNRKVYKLRIIGFIMRKTILIADDSQNNRRLLELGLRRGFPRYNVESFDDGITLDERLNQDLNNVCAVITDNQMPKINGSEIIKKYSSKLNVPFILYYKGNNVYGKQAVRNGAYDYVLRTETEKTIFDVLNEVLGVHNPML